ncbi:calpain-12, partial [Biomphalaria glabrata]
MGCGASKETPSTSNLKEFSQKTKETIEENEEEKDREVVKNTSDVAKAEKIFEGIDGIEEAAKDNYNDGTKFTAESSKKDTDDNKNIGTEESSKKDTDDNKNTEESSKKDTDDNKNIVTEESSKKDTDDNKNIVTEESSKKDTDDNKNIGTEESSKKDTDDNKNIGTGESSKKDTDDNKNIGTGESSKKDTEDNKNIGTGESSKKDTDDNKNIVTEESSKKDTEDNKNIGTEESSKKDTEDNKNIVTEESLNKDNEDNNYTGTEESSNDNIKNEDNKLGTEDKIETNKEVIDKTNQPKGDKDVLENNKKSQEDGASETGYYKNVTGIMERTIDCRRHFKDDEPAKRPKASSDDLFIDTSFLLNLPSGVKYQNMKWKRPKEFRTDPVLTLNGTSRAGVGQGSVGNCWFMSVLANIADNKEFMKQILPETAYFIEDPHKYDGIFHARFFSFGQWRDVYVDDILPISEQGTLVGAMSKTNENEMWVPLVEKAFAKLHGSYEAICSGLCKDAYLQLTSGIGETMEHQKMTNKDFDAFYARIKNALLFNHQVTASTPDKNGEIKGLIGMHAYSVVSVHEINDEKLVQVRNPWGHIDWTGAWSEGSTEWKSIPSNTKNLPDKNNGEFFVCLPDYMKYFSDTTFCSLTPDFDKDGRCNSLNYVLNIFGEWYGKTAAGFRNLLNNPKFSFSVSKQDAVKDGKIPIFIQMIQESKHRKSDNTYILVDIMKVFENQDLQMSSLIVLEQEPRDVFLHSGSLEHTNRYNLEPGTYVIVPTTQHEGVMKAFLLRMFSSGPLHDIREIPSSVNFVACKKEESLKLNGETLNLTYDKVLLGKFINDVNSGGQINELMDHYKNPQYLITIPMTEK